ncbi:MAG TPA: MFS transporter [Pyrinomonadaceae bacterium]|nr:MFS transporter [Pyrinomonadaceae bacterium]
MGSVRGSSAVEEAPEHTKLETSEAPAPVAKTAGASHVGGAAASARASRLPAALRALRHRNYQLFFFGQLVSLTGTWMQSVAQSWLIYRLTGSAVLLGLVGFASQIPVFLLAPVGGAVADRYGRHRILVTTQTVAMLLAFVLAGLTLSGRIEEWHVFALAACLGVANAFDIPARQAFVADMVGRQILHGGASGLGLLMGASGVGALAGALSLAARGGLKGLGRWVAFSSAGFGASVILFSLSRSFWLSAALLLPAGFSMMIEMASSNTLIQAMVPDALRGRVMAVYSMMFMGMAPIGALLAGALAQRLGAPNTVALGGAVCILGAIVFGLRLPALRAEAREIIVALQMAGGDPPEEMTTGEYTALAPGKS